MVVVGGSATARRRRRRTLRHYRSDANTARLRRHRRLEDDAILRDCFSPSLFAGDFLAAPPATHAGRRIPAWGPVHPNRISGQRRNSSAHIAALLLFRELLRGIAAIVLVGHRLRSLWFEAPPGAERGHKTATVDLSGRLRQKSANGRTRASVPRRHSRSSGATCDRTRCWSSRARAWPDHRRPEDSAVDPHDQAARPARPGPRRIPS